MSRRYDDVTGPPRTWQASKIDVPRGAEPDISLEKRGRIQQEENEDQKPQVSIFRVREPDAAGRRIGDILSSYLTSNQADLLVIHGRGLERRDEAWNAPCQLPEAHQPPPIPIVIVPVPSSGDET
jgi:hypothetical protein